MSRTTEINEMYNPAKGTIQWKSESSSFAMYDKNTKSNIEIKKPFKFVVLEKDYVSFNGFNEEAYKGFWSNEVKNPDDLVSVRLGNDVIKTFKKSEWKGTKTEAGVKDDPALKGCKYTQVLYIATKLEDDDDMSIYRLLLSGGAFTGGVSVDKKTGKEHEGQELDGWIRFVGSLNGGRNAAYNYEFSISKSKSKKNGAVTYTIPVFEANPLEEGDKEDFNKMACTVDEWFSYYNSQNNTDTSKSGRNNTVKDDIAAFKQEAGITEQTEVMAEDNLPF